MKSWISFLLPNDEYKKKQMLHFLAEGSIILLLTLIVMIGGINYFNISRETTLMLPVAIFLIYVLGRYTMSGIEYTDVATERAYKKELKRLFIKIGGFAGIFILLYLVFTGVPNNQNEWIKLIGLLLGVSLLWFFISYISLKRSYKKNKELL